MAYAYRLGDARVAQIRLSRADLAAPRLLAALVLDKVGHGLAHASLEGDTLTIEDELCQLERILLRQRNRQVFLLLRDLDGARPDHVEHVLFHHSFFVPFFDYARAAPWDGQPAPGPAPNPRPGLLAAFTHAYDEGDMLRLWEAHYARLAGHRNLYVIDHGSAVSPRALLHPEVNVVALPRGQADHAEMARFCGHFQRFLLSQYQWVLHSDADELLVDEAGGEALLERLAQVRAPVILAPGAALDVIHDVRSEAALRVGEPVGAQRALALPAAEHWKKPLLANMPASWLQGFHQVYEAEVLRQDPGLWLMHLHGADARLLRDKNRRWNALVQSGADRLRCPQGGRPESREELAGWYRQRLADPALIPIPERLRGLF